jgi:hypothetical protein
VLRDDAEGNSLMLRYKKHYWFIAIAGILVAAAAVWLCWIPNSLDILVGDDYAWYQSLYLMHDAVAGTAPRSEIFSNTYYGWPFWLVTFAAGLPFFTHGWESESGVIIASRSVEAIFAGLNAILFLVGLYRTLEDRTQLTHNLFWVWSALALLLMMPVWWEMATRIHPQQMLLFFELTAVLLLLRDDGRIGKSFWLATAAASVAFAIKIEAAMLGPMFLAYLFAAVYCGRVDLRRVVQAGLPAFPMPVICLFFLNPYMFSRQGLESWMRSNFQNLADLHSSQAGGGVIMARINLLTDNFYILPIIFLLLVILIIDAALTFRNRRYVPSQWLAPYIVAALTVAVFVLNGKNYAYYWLPPMMLLLYALIPISYWTSRWPAAFGGIVVALLVSEMVFQAPGTADLMRHRVLGEVYSEMQQKWIKVADARQTASAQAKAVAPFLVRAQRAIVSPYTDISFRELGIRYIDRIYGCLSPEILAPTKGRIPKPAVDLVILRKNDPVLACDFRILSNWHIDGSTFALLKETPYIRVYGIHGS